VTTAAADPSAETTKRGWIAAAIALAGHLVVLLLAFIAAQVVTPSAGGGMEDLAWAAAIFFGGEALLGIACLVTSAVLYRRGWRYTGLGLMGGWIAGFLLGVLIQNLF
jgi:hypothetical protein